MGFVVFIAGVLFVAVVSGQNASVASEDDPRTDDLSDTELVLAFAIFRHGDRTPDNEEIKLYRPDENLDKNAFFPFGMKALTNGGKRRGFAVGKYLRKRYDGLISKFYLPDEVNVRTTSYARTKMTALTALAALYPPPSVQKWNPSLDWQPVPYEYEEYAYDDFMYWYNCPRYLKLRDQAYQEPEIIEMMKPHQKLVNYLREKIGTNITTPEDVFYLDNLFQALGNIGKKPPQWITNVWPEIHEVTTIEFAAEFYTPELIRLSSGVLLNYILNSTSSYIQGDSEQPHLRLYSSHENNVAAIMAAARVYEPHQPSYGATFSLELRKGTVDDRYYIVAAYAENAGGPARILPIQGCGGGPLCEYEKFVELVKEYTLSKKEYYKICEIVPSV